MKHAKAFAQQVYNAAIFATTWFFARWAGNVRWHYIEAVGAV